MSVLRKHSIWVTLLSALAAAYAGPYLVPVSPESFVMRAGVLSALLFITAASLIPSALRSFPARAWRQALIFSYFFALALSIGSEFAIYDSFLPGLSSLLRRLLVPALISPLLGALLLSLARLSIPGAKPPVRHAYPLYLLFLLLCWTPILLAYWPGMLNYDFVGEYRQHLDGAYSMLHPLLHSVIMNGVITLGELLSDRTLGLLLMTLLQMICFAAVLAYGCHLLQRLGIPRVFIYSLLLLFGLHPVFSVLSVSMTKDTLFAAALCGLVFKSLELLLNPDDFFSRKRNLFVYILFAVGTALIRGNGIFAILPLLVAVLIHVPRSARSHTVILTALCLLTTLLTHFLMAVCLSPSSMPTFQLFSLPAQQLVRAYNKGSMSEADREELEGWYLSEEGLRLHPHLADPAKGYLKSDRLTKESREFLRLWLRVGRDCPKEYLEAFLMLNIGSWYPDDLSHSTIYPDVSYNEKGYLQTQEYDLADLGFHTRSFLPRLRAFYEQMCRYNRYQKYPVISLLFSTGIPIWLLLLAFHINRINGKKGLAPFAAPVGLFISYLLGPCTLARYMLPLFILSPCALLLALCRVLPDQEPRSPARS